MSLLARGTLLAAALFAAPLAPSQPWTALFAVALGCALSVSILGALTPFAIAAGALGAMTLVAGTPMVGPFAAAAIFAMLIALPRAVRATEPLFGALALLGTSGAAVAAVWLRDRFASGSLAETIAAAVIASVLCAIPLLTKIDDAIAWRLRKAATRASGPRRIRLVRALLARRAGIPELPDSIDDSIETGWERLADAAESSIEHSVLVRQVNALENAQSTAHRYDRLRVTLRVESETAAEVEEQLRGEVAALEEAEALVH